jgi:Lrp/AsnC family leucine-responsive transcriptional regulator
MLLDATDARILETLQEEGRITNADLATRIGLSAGATLARVGKLEAAGFICGYKAILDRPGLGLGVTAFVAVILKSHGRQESADFLEAVKDIQSVLECHHIAGDEDYLLKVVAANPSDFETFVLDQLTSIPAVHRVKTTFVLSSPKASTSIPIRTGTKESAQ